MDDRRRHRDVAAAGQLPDFLAGLEIVRAHVPPAVDDELRLPVHLMHRRRAPRRHVTPRDAPQLLAAPGVERPEERPLLNIRLDDHDVVVKDGRAPGFPLRRRVGEPAGVEHAEVLLPEQLALEVVGVEPFRPEKGDQAFAVGGERGVRVRGLRVALDLRNRLEDRLLPVHRAGLLVEAVDAPLVLGVVQDGLDVAVETDLQAGVLLAADRRADADEVPPDDRGSTGRGRARRSSRRRPRPWPRPRSRAGRTPRRRRSARIPRNCGQSTPGFASRRGPRVESARQKPARP